MYSKENNIPRVPIGWKAYVSKSNRAGIIVRNPNIFTATIAIKHDSVGIKCKTKEQEITIYSLYSSPSEDQEETINSLPAHINHKGKTILAENFNAHSKAWGCAKEDIRGKLILDYIASNQLKVANDPNSTPTFNRDTAKGWPDLTQDMESTTTLKTGK
ncbi:hypothetical protein CEXT_663461 [Caerostris extrusa]|uniref:Endonuclease/exonuclease/phosphatase domain-containing protein n=1 Tax=Caerostris extrusa TaxID=172846 RepID=A0AAV4YAE2_CAEEX|nr:hypothetical protein CEXT_663461 [Caerostris extrusa]